MTDSKKGVVGCMSTIRRITKENPFKILGFTDTHLDDYADRFEVTLSLLKETIQVEKPDLVVFVGDNVTGGDNRARARIFQETMTELGVLWAPVLGNHEADNPLSMKRDEMAKEFIKSPFCLIPSERVKRLDGTTVYGETNYAISLQNAKGEIIHKLIFLDCGPDMTKEECKAYGIVTDKENPDGCLKESQILWYREQVRSHDCYSTVFCHIPIPEYEDAYENGKILYGKNYERVSCALRNSGLFDAICEEGHTKTIVSGHDHVNFSRVLYQGVVMAYNRMSGMSSYNAVSKKVSDKLLQGCTVYWIDENGRLTFDDIIYEDRYPQYHDEMYRVIRKE